MVVLIGMPGGLEWLLIFAAVLLLFGGKKIPQLMKGIGKGVQEFNNAKKQVKDQIKEGMNENPEETDVEKKSG